MRGRGRLRVAQTLFADGIKFAEGSGKREDMAESFPCVATFPRRLRLCDALKGGNRLTEFAPQYVADLCGSFV